MTLPEGFLFSQSNLQDYVDCQRRFQLRHMLHLAWPAVEAEPYIENERRIDQGAQFHKIVRQFLLGVPKSQISRTIIGDEVMQHWWENFLNALEGGTLEFILQPDSQHFEEITLSTPIEKFRLIAKYDLLIVQPDDKVVIIDYKTSQNHPSRKWLANRVQTHVYPFVLTRALPGFLAGHKVDPAHIAMVYWFTNQPEQPERFSYSARDYESDLHLLSDLIATIEQKTENIFPLTPEVKRCLFCTYRSLCNRGVKPGSVEQLEEWQEPASAEEVSLDLDQIGEIEL